MNDATPLQSDNKVELTHIVAQLVTVLAAMALVYFVVHLSMDHLKTGNPGEIKASDVVAVVGAVTTFLGTAIGLFFGVSVGQAGKKSADNAAQAAQQHAKDSASVAQQAQAITSQSLVLADKAQGASQTAADQLQNFQAQIESLKEHSDRLTSKVGQLRQLASPMHAVRASAIFDSAVSGNRPSSSKIQEMVSDIVCAQIVADGGETSPDRVDTTRKISASPPTGYGIDGESYVRFCNDCVRQINSECESKVDPADPKLQGDISGTVDAFIDDASQLAIDNPA